MVWAVCGGPLQISSGTAIREARALQATLAQERKNRQQVPRGDFR